MNTYYLQNLPDKAPSSFKTLQLVAQGYDYHQVAELKHNAYGTIKNQLEQMRNQVGAKNTAHLISLAHQVGIL